MASVGSSQSLSHFSLSMAARNATVVHQRGLGAIGKTISPAEYQATSHISLSLSVESASNQSHTFISLSTMSSKGGLTLLELKIRAKAKEDVTTSRTDRRGKKEEQFRISFTNLVLAGIQEEKAKAARKRNILILIQDYLANNG